MSTALVLAAAKSGPHLNLSPGVWVLIAAVLLLPSFIVPATYVFVSARRVKASPMHPSVVDADGRAEPIDRAEAADRAEVADPAGL